ncbi:hypothetical protein [Rhodoplanes serenus]|uniref:hypothetical protein n=1 Tax=Rhodoplanes serenus TaxID=200615 RepID=UPI001474855F|nr:hypothetical protein [Rhodoplanes serenus]
MSTRRAKTPTFALEPARSVIEKLGGVQAVASMTGKHISRIYRWMYPVERGGTGGLIPTQQQPILLDEARARDLDLKPEDFFVRGGTTERAAS